MQLFFNSSISENDKEITFDKNESRHIIKVLRKKEGDTLHITNGNNFLFTVKIRVASDKKCIASIAEVFQKKSSRNYTLHIAIAPTKNNDRFEWFLEKATEIGIDEITPIICANSERKSIKKERMEKIIQAAMKQSLQYKLPHLNDTVRCLDFINSKKDGELFIAHCEKSTEKPTIQKCSTPGNSYTILIGPEGDFSPAEIQSAIKMNYQPISLGENRLRTETAGITAASHIAFVNEKDY
ncbi:16S rRNA (uracil(1498)-N(3))-methyltransferase [Tenacibaculum sp. SG-28]|uniref:16S rRNA (uracil(1498)-N(3))-methyltransferase n=1 Tax=Tenacibaculum sp. SG-28 TaxID=754426 RepID=UPI000CF4E1C6|nr:16S rRNA (uracil(1498)-N(3))-methyltransferase [Tenacibaculum sp. SG-28]PQJ23043.1 16S rRNA (uracil(1498)-N(3))-methyltransferase [Tenacibaculum sp. SG-28]